MIDCLCSDKTNSKLSIHQREQVSGILRPLFGHWQMGWNSCLALACSSILLYSIQQQKQLAARYAREPYWLWHLFQLEDKPFSHAILSAIFTDDEFDSCSARSCPTYSHVASQPSLASQIISSSQKKLLSTFLQMRALNITVDLFSFFNFSPR